MNRIATFVDAGYFWAQLSQLIYHERKRQPIHIDLEEMRISLLRQIDYIFPQSSLLRIYWYDGLGQNNQPTSQHKFISLMNDFKIRYGTINSEGKQKAVDGLIIADLISLAQNKAIQSALLVSGDADLAPGVVAAQMLGVRVHMLEIGSSNASSPVLIEAVDEKDIWSESEIFKFSSKNDTYNQGISNALENDSSYKNQCEIYLSDKIEANEITELEIESTCVESGRREILPSIPNVPQIPQDDSKIIASSFLKTLNSDQLASIKDNPEHIPHEIDKELIFYTKKQLKQDWIDTWLLQNIRRYVRSFDS